MALASHYFIIGVISNVRNLEEEGMSTIDPTLPEVGGIDELDQELTVEEVAQMDESEISIAESRAERAYEPSESEPTTERISEISEAQTIVEPPLAPSTREVLPEKIARAFPAPQPPLRAVPVKRKVTGRYVNCPRPWKLELRVDVDGYRPMRRISGDFYYISGATTSYFGSFIVNAPSVSVTTSQVTVVGIANTTWTTSYNKLRIVIPRHTIFQPAANATAQWMTTTNKRGATYTCLYEAPYFRTVDLEQDYEQGVTPFSSYNTGSLPSGGPARTLSVARAYAEAGIQMRTAGVSNEIKTAEAIGGRSNVCWNNAELHNAMQKHFRLWQNAPQWKVWLFHANCHEMGPGLLGIMFDQKGKQRQGCASFYQRIAGTAPEKLRDQLYVCVHELGHCFNLFHSFHKKFMDPPMPNRPAARSWMNYPQRFPGGASAYWNAFPFQFDNLETIHLRHSFRNNIVMGGNPFGKGAAVEDSQAFADNIDDNSGIKLELETHKSFAFGEPLIVEIKLYMTDTRGKRVHKHLHPNYGFVQIGIQKPSGDIVAFHPPIEHCMEAETIILDESNPSIYESAYIGYDKDRGHVFDQPGVYKLRGLYYAIDGSVVLSNVLTVRVRNPLSSTDEEVADLLLGEDQGMLIYLHGSYSEFLQTGNKALDEILDKYSNHPLSVYAQWIKGLNAGRDFKSIEEDNTLRVRKSEPGNAEKWLSAVVKASEKAAGVDNITLNSTMRRLAEVQSAEGKTKEAKATMTNMVNIFKKKSLKQHVLQQIKEQANQVIKRL